MGMRTSPLGCIVKIRTSPVTWDMTEELQRRTGQVSQNWSCTSCQAAQLTAHCNFEHRQG